MAALIVYMLKVLLCSAILYGYYLLVLKDRRFHYYNRFYLLAVASFSWMIPLIKINLKQVQGSLQSTPYQLAEIIADNNGEFDGMAESVSSSMDWTPIAHMIFGLVSTIFFLGLVRSFIRVYQLVRAYPIQRLNGLNLVMTDASGTPYSFFSYIFWNRSIDLESRVGKQMLAHEWVHSKEKHSVDKLFIEMMMVVGWFNPIFWILKRELYLIHEFIADSQSIENQDSGLLAELLLAAAYPQQQNRLTHPFFFSPIKRRITMLKKNALPRFSYFRRLLVIPIVSALFLLFAFRNSNSNNHLLNLDKQYVVVLDAGHGGTDPGAKSSTGITEAEMALAMAKRIVALNKNSNIRFELSREKDEFIRVNDRATYAVEKKADLFVSIHMNASPNNQRSGLEIFCPQQSSLGFLRSLHLAGVLKLTLDSEFKSSAVKTRKDKIWILDHSTVPAVIVLPGYITNPKDFSHMQSRQEEIASKILMGIENYLIEKERGYIKVPIEAEWEQALPKKQEPQK
jgi:N-acetylmuramoyl-L-alanine amidase